MKCPLCGCQTFYVKDPDDEYETCEFELRDGRVQFTGEDEASCSPEVGDDSETYCNKCSWHGKLEDLGVQ